MRLRVLSLAALLGITSCDADSRDAAATGLGRVEGEPTPQKLRAAALAQCARIQACALPESVLPYCAKLEESIAQANTEEERRRIAEALNMFAGCMHLACVPMTTCFSSIAGERMMENIRENQRQLEAKERAAASARAQSKPASASSAGPMRPACNCKAKDPLCDCR